MVTPALQTSPHFCSIAPLLTSHHHQHQSQIYQLDSPRFMTSPLLPSNFHLDHYGHSTSRAAAQQTNTNQPPDISLDSPPNSPPRHTKEDGFFTDMEGQPELSCDKGIEDVMKSLTVHSHKASGSALRGRSPATCHIPYSEPNFPSLSSSIFLLCMSHLSRISPATSVHHPI
jgi:hypothetical protein